MTEHPETPRIASGDRRADSAHRPSDRSGSPFPCENGVKPRGQHRLSTSGPLSSRAWSPQGLIYLGSAGPGAVGWLTVQPPTDPVRGDRTGPRPTRLVSRRERPFWRVSGAGRRIGDNPGSRHGTRTDQIVVRAESHGSEGRQVSYPPQAWRVELQYREPVALVDIPRRQHKYLLDEKARILPLMDVDRGRTHPLGPIIRIAGNDLVDPLDPRPNDIWNPRPGVHDAAAGIARIPAAARLASYLVQRNPRARPVSADGTGDPLDRSDGIWPRSVHLERRESSDPVGQAPGEEPPGRCRRRREMDHASPLERARTRIATRRPPGYWRFTKVGLSATTSSTRTEILDK